MPNYKRTPISTNMLDTADYLDTKTNLASTVLQSTKKILELSDSLIFWGSLHFVDQNQSLARSKSAMPNYRCAPF